MTTSQATAKKIPTTLKAVEGAKRTDVFRLPHDQIHIEEGFNLRNESSPETLAHIESIFQSIMAGERVPPLDVRMKDGRATVDDGYCRHTAIGMAIATGKYYGEVECMPSKVKEEERVFLMINRNSGLGFTPLELAKGYQRLLNDGFTQTEIAKRVGRTDASISQALMVLRADKSIHAAITEGKMSFTTAHQICNEHGKNAAEAAAELIAKAEEAGQSKVTAKTAKALKGKLTRVVPKKAYVEVSEKASNIIESLKGWDEIRDLENASEDSLQGSTIGVDAVLLKQLLDAHNDLMAAKAEAKPEDQKEPEVSVEENHEMDFGEKQKLKMA